MSSAHDEVAEKNGLACFLDAVDRFSLDLASIDVLMALYSK